jgi:hypothetical protein
MLCIVACFLVGFGVFNYLACPGEELANAKLITKLLPHENAIVQI